LNWTITLRKTLTSAAAGAVMAVGALTITQDDPNYWTALLVAAGLGAIRGGLNAWKHL
jgi:hypothetical protein